jgi:hypothetical protein
LRLSRRSLLIGGGTVAALGVAGTSFAQRPAALEGPAAIEVRARPIASLSAEDRERRRFGGLTFRSGLDLSSPNPVFGGFSGLSRSADGRSLVAVSDASHWLTARVESAARHLFGLSGVVMAPVLGRSGRPLRGSRSYDTEGLSIVGGTAYVSIERTHEVVRFDWGKDGFLARAQPLPVPAAAKDLPSNRSFEAIALAPPGSPIAGSLIVIAERSGIGESAPTLGFILSGSRRGAFEVARSDDFDVTDLAFLPNGEALLLERYFSLFRGPGARIRRIAAEAFRPGALVDGDVIYRSDPSHEIDNMEGLAIHESGGDTILTLISDNNFNSFQRTVLLEFVLNA